MAVIGMVLGLVLVVLGFGLRRTGSQANRSVRARDINGNINQGDVTVNLGRTGAGGAVPDRTSRDWFAWSGWILSAVGVVLTVVGLYYTIVPPGH